jgi:hypothetical protein
MIPFALLTNSASALVSNTAAKGGFAPACVWTLAETHEEWEFMRAGAARDPACFIEPLPGET